MPTMRPFTSEGLPLAALCHNHLPVWRRPVWCRMLGQWQAAQKAPGNAM